MQCTPYSPSTHVQKPNARTEEIKRVEEIASTLTGEANRRAVDHLVELLHYSTYHDVAESMSAAGMMAPFIESIFRSVCRKMGHELPQRDFVANVVKFLGSEGRDIKEYMPADLEVTLEALFLYGNRLFHHGFSNGEMKSARNSISTCRNGHAVGLAALPLGDDQRCSI